MADPDLSTLAHAWAERTSEPDFDALVSRAHGRRRRRVLSLLASAAAVLLVVVLSAFLAVRGPSAAPVPTDQQADPTRHPAWIVAHGRLMSYAAGLGGWTSSGPPPDAPDRVMTVWQHCRPDNTGCRSAWRLTDWHGQEVGTGLAPASTHEGSSPSAYAEGDIFVLRSWDRGGIVVEPDGTTRPLLSATQGTVTPGDVLIRHGGGLDVADPRTATTWPLRVPGESIAKATGILSSDGTVWVMPAGTTTSGVTLRWLRAGTWHSRQLAHSPASGAPPVPGLIATSGRHVAAMSTFDGATVLPVGTFAVSTDDGDHWTDLRKDQLPFTFVDSMAATSGGTLYVVGDPNGQGTWDLFRSTDATWTHFEEVHGVHHVSGLEPGGPVVLGSSGSAHGPQVVAFDADGHRVEVPVR